MIELSSRTWYIENTEKLIDELKSQSLTFDAINSIKAMRECSDRTQSQQKIYTWLLNALKNKTVQDDAETLTFEEASYAYYFFHAVYDCVTMVV